uniref:DUF5127 domain-containing protein n=1 Tax=uncultured Sunxiuqinia sp. TaxID=1573825 RepID=UPI0030D9969A
MQTKLYLSLMVIAAGLLTGACQQSTVKSAKPVTSEFRAPAYPLITIDPYTSAWSMTDQLFDEPVKHWTGETHSLIGAIRVDGQVYRFLGKEDIPWKTLLPLSKEEAWEAKYTTSSPSKGWEQSDFNDQSWQTGAGAFGTPGHQATKTNWDSDDIWVRREFTMPELDPADPLYLVYFHDDDFELYLNGKEIVNTGNRARRDVVLKIDASLLNKSGKNVIAVHCRDRGGLAYVDFGLFTESDQKQVFAQTASQTKVSLSATQTHYEFTCGPVDLKLQFVSPLLPNNLDLLSRPVNYINYQVVSNDGAEHDVQIYFETTPEWAVNEPTQDVEVSKGKAGGIGFVKTGTIEQPVLEKKGDNIRIDWGYFYLAANQNEKTSLAIGDYFETKNDFNQTGTVTGTDKMTARPSKQMPAMVCIKSLGTVSGNTASGYVMLAYDDLESIQYF